MKTMKHNRKIILWALACLLFLGWMDTAALSVPDGDTALVERAHESDEDMSNAKRPVLIISSYSPLRESGVQSILAFTENLGPRINHRIAVEYMDVDSPWEVEKWEEWMQNLFSAYSKKPVVVVLHGLEAWLIYRNTCPEDWRDIPVVLGSVRKQYIERFSPQGDGSLSDTERLRSIEDSFGDFKVTGFYIEDYFEQDFQLIRHLQPQARHVVFVYDDPYGMVFSRERLSRLALEEGFEDMIYLSGQEFSTQQVLDTIAGMDQSYALLSAGWYSDVNNFPQASSVFNNELNWDFSKYMFMVLDLGFTNISELGGYYVSAREKGNALADLTYVVLSEGFEHSPRFGLINVPPRYHVNYIALRNAGIDLSQVPAGTVFYNRPTSIFRDYLWETIVVALLFVAVVVIFVLIIVHRKNQERFYRNANNRMKRLIEAMPNTAVIFDAALKVKEVINPRPGFDQTTLKGLSAERLAAVPGYEQGAGAAIASNVKQTYRSGKVRSFYYQVREGEEISYLDARTVPYLGGVICFVYDNTDHIRAQNEVEKLQAFLQSVVDNLPVGLHVKNASDGFRYVLSNQKARDFYAGAFFDKKGGREAGLEAFVPGRFQQDDIAAQHSEVPLTFERQMYDANGKPVKSGLATKSKWINNDGSCYVITVLVDLTEAKRKETQLYNAQKQLSMAFDAGSLAAWAYDCDDRRFSPLYHSQTISGDGISLDQAMAKVHPDDRLRFAEMIRQLSAGQAEKTKEILRFDLGEGTYEWFEIYSIGVADSSGTINRIIGTEKNITRSLEDERKLKEYTFKFEMVARSVGFVQWDYEVREQRFFSPDPMSPFYHGQTLEKFLRRVYPEDIPVITEGLDQLVGGERNVLTVEVRVEMPQVGLRWMEIQAVVFTRDERGRAVKITGLRRDITESKNITEELIVLRDKAEESNRLKSAFLANMSHEIRTPLNAIIGFSELIAQTDDKDEAREYFDLVQTNNELLLRLINDILDLSKIESGHLEFVYTDVDICTIFRQQEQIYRKKLKPGVELVCSLPDDSFILRSEKDRLTQVISNFLSNAVKFTSEGFIRMGYEHLGDRIRCYVSDTGKGIAKENPPKVFVRFAKFDSFVQGTGLGLSICEVIVKHMGGQIGAESELGKGSTFWFTVPVGTAAKDPMAEEIGRTMQNMEMEEREDAKQTAGRKSILVAEDNDSNYLLVSALLKKDYDLTRAADGVEAVEMYRCGHFDMILMDIRMPRMTGLEATQEIRKTDPDIPIVAVTAYAFESNREEILRAGCNRVVTKPINKAKLTEVLDQYLAQTDPAR